ncbi:hypothetical protein BGW80DRAFT_1299219 [Lactifluus volemus]|nr:hypothetical protein BGW80DRAFT_1299219 [Lactifluus volemus]
MIHWQLYELGSWTPDISKSDWLHHHLLRSYGRYFHAQQLHLVDPTCSTALLIIQITRTCIRPVPRETKTENRKRESQDSFHQHHCHHRKLLSGWMMRIKCSRNDG